ncbi:outer membrane lipoprotein-sorting protein [Halonatronum saccharophilum]|uniref:outer membrane lipoprotein-sorting protein n=1 Tax=Halonatronum saccharophilum TaxID=150060 RepID=UPI0004820ED5|nr:outer membrane lipoprotein-sorting protein [Halonatronum saccharophilum]
MKRTKIVSLFIMILIMFHIGLLADQVTGEDESITAREIVEKSNILSRVEGIQAELNMKIINSSGQERVRRLRSISKEDNKGVEKSLIHFLEPANVRGTGFLSITNPEEADERYLYLPALGRPRRISSEERGGSFMGTDFSYEDITFNIDDYTYKLVREEILNEREVYVVKAEGISREIKSNVGFAKRTIFIRKDNFVPVKSEYFNDMGEKIKIMRAYDIEEVNDGIWFSTRMEMEDVNKGSRTELVYEDIKVNVNISDDYFSIRQLSRFR